MKRPLSQLPFLNTFFKAKKTMKPSPVSAGWLRPAICLATAVVLFVSGTSRAFAQATPTPPERMTYQGFLVDANGDALGFPTPKNYDVIFRIFDDQSGPNILWAEQQTVTVDKGYFSVLLGEGADAGGPRPALSTLFKGATASDRYVGVTVKGIGQGGANVDILPRLRLLTSPYAFLAQQSTKLVKANGADLISGNNDAVTVSGTVTANSFTGNGANLSAINANSITTGTLDNARTTAASGRGNNTLVMRDGEGGFSMNHLNASTVVADGNRTTHVQGAHLEWNKDGSSGMTYLLNQKGLGGGGIVFGEVNGANAVTEVMRANTGGLYLNGNFHMGNGNTLQAKNANGDYENYLWPRWVDNITYMNFGQNGFNIRNNGSGTVMFMKNNGYVGIGSTDPEAPLTILNDNAFFRIKRPNGFYADMYRQGGTGASGALVLRLNQSHWSAGDRYAVYDGDSNWDFTSDRKLKKDIADVEPMLDRALKVQVRRFRWKDNTADSKLQLGVIAQEIQPLFPDMIGELEDPTTKEKSLTVGYGDFAVIAIKSIQELKARQDAEVADLKAQIAELKAQMKEVLQASADLRGQTEKSKVTAAVGR